MAAATPEPEPWSQRPLSSVWTREVGATWPLSDPEEGMRRWDPAGLSSGDNASKFGQYRAAELKHGRVAMLAVVGLVAEHYVKSGQVEILPSGLGGRQALGLLIFLAGLLELRAIGKFGEGLAFRDDPANFRESFGQNVPDDAALKTYELEHGRLAMLGFLGTLAAQYLTGYDAVEQWEHAGEAFARR